MPGYSSQHLTWISPSSNCLAQIPALDAEEPWCDGWVDAPAQHPYNTTFAPCNSEFPLFGPVSQTRKSVGRQIQVNPLISNSELSKFGR
ncbi:hypothetical protein JG688_00016731 [Phytophthora aleatoria]|uniref:Uncharacterized protein n=1 Tax=Phytophthora aleatoria TaxID=2496075 RepID=A0A8J5I7V3_9STRA|nr:hypothetical protein JG688_00016731 [Phytophthora aleatoria]